MAPVWLWFQTTFDLRLPHEDRVWPGQDPALFGDFVTPAGLPLGQCRANLILQAKPALALQLTMPDASNAQLARAVPWLQAALPMRLSSKHWTRWTLANNGRSYVGRKLDVKTISTGENLG